MNFHINRVLDNFLCYASSMYVGALSLLHYGVRLGEREAQ